MMKKSKVSKVNITILVCLTITVQSYSDAIAYLKPACIISFITAGGYMLYHDYQYGIATYKAFKAECAREQLLAKIAKNPLEQSPHPIWWVAKHHQITVLKKKAAELKNRALLYRLMTHLFARYKSNRSFQNT